MNRKSIDHGTRLPVSFSAQELEDIRGCSMIGEEFGRCAAVASKRLHLDLSLDEIEEIQGHIAADANDTLDAKRRQRLDKLFDKFQNFLDRYDDQG